MDNSMKTLVNLLQTFIKNIEDDRVQFFIGDTVEYTDKGLNIPCISRIRYPKCYTSKNECVYVLEDYDIPIIESELKLILPNRNGRELTIEYCEDLLKKACKTRNLLKEEL